LSSEAYATAVDQVMRLGSKAGSTRTADQTQIAEFWADGGGAFTPPGHWSRVYGGIHFLFDGAEGLKAGYSIGALVHSTMLRPKIS
jgi:hypothetical protein